MQKMSLFWSKFPISETKKYNNKVKTCKYKHKIISPFSSRHLGWIPLLMWTKKLCITPFTISILFPDTCPECRFSFRAFLICVLFQQFSLFPPGPKCWTFSRTPTHTHTPMASLARFPKHPQTIFFICFVFSNELDVKFNTHTHSHTHMQKKNCAELFLFEFFDSQSRKLLKRVKVSQKKHIFFMIIEKEEDDEAVVVRRGKKHPQIKHTNTNIP